MNCQEFEHRLNAILDERGDPTTDSRLLAHARYCPQCRELITGQRLLLSGVRKLTMPELGEDFSRRVMAQVVVRPAAVVSAGRAWLALGVILASAAAVLLAVSVVWYARHRGAQFARKEPSPAHIAGPARPPPRPPIDDARSASREYEALIRRQSHH